MIDFSGKPSNTDGVAEDSRTTWGNTLGRNVMSGADTWSAKEYKGHIFAGDMLRGFERLRLRLVHRSRLHGAGGRHIRGRSRGQRADRPGDRRHRLSWGKGRVQRMDQSA